ncbi:MAG: hypothetical protein COV55_01380 [Candidatus Komeilibacteria bacterium CG11_big_fil_rev_8_21_14_0_20_36_20]|uniref:Uncharacterized protein n=1 Tax=Candidatus Komeilibacteria bacterium CG11_big_fil_rev_8_21_14_0_20_36_20 TaxID=1974477 RepID=A0A2H0NDU3_9BACT|nr:MAG: hypothetical protein COV55_01380 [Candidatus Komeilibacteria bacterium CG11_big_fil_rev_8_21_14_0_20_36_20]PJC55158.1 MAG: hypothetical protein CO027_03305 [Candidatus Komeilibacteria bacterium CG_4_9_14_0_2_um_filter_36_13]
MFDDLKQSKQNLNTDFQIPQPTTSSSTSEPAKEPVQAEGQVSKMESVSASGKIDDMFADVDPVADKAPVAVSSASGSLSGLQSGKLKPISQTSLPSSQPPPSTSSLDKMVVKDEREGIMRKKIIIIFGVLVALAVVVVIYLFATGKFNSGDNANIELNQNVNLNTNTNFNLNDNANEEINQNINLNENVNVPPLNEEEMDDDSDGLTNAEEKELGSDPLNPDSDNDGLFDREEAVTYKTDPTSSDSDDDGLSDYDEINIWQTDPNNPDTDDDGYSDGLEVSNGYNPLGEGVLVE